MEKDYELIQNNLVSIAIESYRFEKVFQKALSRLPIEERNKYNSQFMWFSKKVNSALDDSGIKLVSLEGKIYDPGMAVTPLNLDDFDVDDDLFILQMIEPIIMKDDKLFKTGTVILERAKQ